MSSLPTVPTPEETLRYAVLLLREHADGAIAELHGSTDWHGIGTGYRAGVRDHISLMSPLVARAAAAWLDRIAWTWSVDASIQARVGGDEALAFALAVIDAAELSHPTPTTKENPA